MRMCEGGDPLYKQGVNDGALRKLLALLVESGLLDGLKGKDAEPAVAEEPEVAVEEPVDDGEESEPEELMEAMDEMPEKKKPKAISMSLTQLSAMPKGGAEKKKRFR